MHSQISHHLDQRKRIHQKHEPYPHPDPKFRKLDQLVIIVSMIYPLTAIPQIIKIWQVQDVSGISLLTWSIWLLLAFPMLLYGIVHKTKPFIIMYSLWIVIQMAVIFSILKFS